MKSGKSEKSKHEINYSLFNIIGYCNYYYLVAQGLAGKMRIENLREINHDWPTAEKIRVLIENIKILEATKITIPHLWEKVEGDGMLLEAYKLHDYYMSEISN